jgi:hypothetical protein
VDCTRPFGQVADPVLKEQSWNPLGTVGAHTEPAEQPPPAAGKEHVSPGSSVTAGLVTTAGAPPQAPAVVVGDPWKMKSLLPAMEFLPVCTQAPFATASHAP